MQSCSREGGVCLEELDKVCLLEYLVFVKIPVVEMLEVIYWTGNIGEAEDNLSAPITQGCAMATLIFWSYTLVEGCLRIDNPYSRSCIPHNQFNIRIIR